MAQNGVLLIQPTNFYLQATNTVAIRKVPIQLIYLANGITQKVHLATKILDLRYVDWGNSIQKDEARIIKLERLISENVQDCRYIGISCYASHDFLMTLQIAKIVKMLDSSKVVIVGGIHVTYMPEDFFFEGSNIDYVIQGESDWEFPALIEKLENHPNPPSNRTKSIIAPFIEDLNPLPEIDWTPYDLNFIPKDQVLEIPFYSSRGCPFSCSFCVTPTTPSQSYGKTWRFLEIPRVVREIQKIRAYFAEKKCNLFFADPNFGFNAKWRSKILENLSADRFDLPILAEIRIDNLRNDDIALFARLKSSISFGLESGSLTMLKIMNKTNNPETFLQRMLEIAKNFEKHQTYWHPYILVGHPGETMTTINETFDYVEKLFSNTHYGAPMTNNFSLYPGSTVYQNQAFYEKKYGTTFCNPHWYYMPVDPASVSFIHPSRQLSFQAMMHHILTRGGELMGSIEQNFTFNHEKGFARYMQSIFEFNQLKKIPAFQTIFCRDLVPKSEELQLKTQEFWNNDLRIKCPIF